MKIVDSHHHFWDLEKFSYDDWMDPKSILAAGWNVGIKNCSGEIIIAANAHATIEKNHLLECIKYLKEYDADCVGPTLVTHPQDESLIGKSIATMMAHPFGVGNSAFRTASNVNKPEFVDTLHLGAYRKEVFEKIGMYNEELIRSQDKELHKRLLKAGFRMLLVPTIKVHYFTRSNPKGFLKYGILNGYWVTNPWSLGTSIASLRHLIPMIFVLSLSFSILLSLFFSLSNFLYVLSAAYILFAFSASVNVAFTKKDAMYLVTMPLIFFTYHTTYGVGSVLGALKAIFSRRAWAFVFR